MQLAARYDGDVESEVLRWFSELIGEEVKPGMREVEKQLRNGIALVKLVIEIFSTCMHVACTPLIVSIGMTRVHTQNGSIMVE